MMLEEVELPFMGIGVAAPVSIADVDGSGVEEPLLSWVAITEASFREASDMICFMFLFRRCEGFHAGLRNGRRLSVRSS